MRRELGVLKEKRSDYFILLNKNILLLISFSFKLKIENVKLSILLKGIYLFLVTLRISVGNIAKKASFNVGILFHYFSIFGINWTIVI